MQDDTVPSRKGGTADRKIRPWNMFRGLIKRVSSLRQEPESHNQLDTSEGAVSAVNRDDDTGNEG